MRNGKQAYTFGSYDLPNQHVIILIYANLLKRDMHMCSITII